MSSVPSGWRVTVGIIVGALQFDKLPFVNQGKRVLGLLRRRRRAEDRVRRCRSRVSRSVQVKSIKLDGPRVLVKFNVDKRHPARRSHGGGDQDQGTAGLEGARGHTARRRPAGRHDSDGADHVALSAAGCARRSRDHHQRAQHRSAVGLADGVVRRPSPTHHRTCGRGRRCGAVLADPRRARCRIARCWANARQGHDRAGPPHRPDRQADLQHERAAGRIANPKRSTGSARRQHLRAEQATAGLHRRQPHHDSSPRWTSSTACSPSSTTARTRCRSRSSCYALTPCLWASRCRPGPFFKAYVANLLPGQFAQPFVDAAFSDLGLDPNVLLPSQRTDPQVGQPGTPALPVPYPGRVKADEPKLTLPDAITGNPGDQGCGFPGVPLPGPGCYPYREPLPAPPPGGPPPGPPAVAPPGLASIPTPTPSPVMVPAPGEVPHLAPAGAGQ